MRWMDRVQMPIDITTFLYTRYPAFYLLGIRNIFFGDKESGM
jgi:hypothetical protein